ncbi:hypothetical protein [Streptomyces sp. CMB-StM0423]|uniref:hypothetical protein n=1 Tax=Streptomyces sp. CMB-StM0423 TaxID=2059884 RepID=UPI0018FE1A42|nr:hypothetical protein [Streptomyces sp. CMB-StM0423]
MTSLQVARGSSWELRRVDGEDFWRLTNISEEPLFPIRVVFSCSENGSGWTDSVLLELTVPILNPGGATRMHVVGSDCVTQAVVRWRRRRRLPIPVREWTVRF